MNLNYIIAGENQDENCPASPTGLKKHNWLSTNEIETKHGGEVFVRFICKRCKKTHDQLLTTKEFHLFERAIELNKFMEY